MHKFYKVLAYIIVVEVAVQAMAVVYGVAGLDRWVEHGGVFDKSVISEHKSVFPETIAFPVHGLNGTYLIPLFALLLFVTAFFARIPGGLKWAGLVLTLVVVQVLLGYTAGEVPAIGSLHGVNALLLFVSALHAGRRVSRASAVPSTMGADAVDVSMKS